MFSKLLSKHFAVLFSLSWFTVIICFLFYHSCKLFQVALSHKIAANILSSKQKYDLSLHKQHGVAWSKCKYVVLFYRVLLLVTRYKVAISEGAIKTDCYNAGQSLTNYKPHEAQLRGQCH